MIAFLNEAEIDFLGDEGQPSFWAKMDDQCWFIYSDNDNEITDKMITHE